MNDDGWYSSFVSRANPTVISKSPSQRRKTINEDIRTDVAPVEALFKPVVDKIRQQEPPKATVARRAKSYSDFYDVVRAHIKKENKLEKERERKKHRRKQVKNDLEFGSWYHGLQNDLLDASQEEYRLYRDQLHLAEEHLESLLNGTNAVLQLLINLSNNFREVETQTTSFQAQCEDLLSDQNRTIMLANGIAENLQFYTYLEPMTRRLNAPGAGRLVGGREFSDMLSNLDTCLEYMQAHPKHRESASYRSRYRLLLTRALTLIRNHFANSLKDVVADVTKRIAERQLNETTQSALLYAKFRVPAPEMKAIGLEIQKRAILPEGAEPGSEAEYQSLMNELYQSYGAARGKLLRPIINKNMSEIAASPNTSKDLVSFARSSISFIRGICSDEYDLWGEWFASDAALYSFLEEMMDPFYDQLRPRIIHETQIQKLCELCTLIQTRYMDDEDEDEPNSPGPPKLDFGHLIAPALEDAQSRLVFLTLTTLRNDIEYYKPKPNDLDYPTRSSRAPQSGSRANGPVLSGRKSTNGPFSKTASIADEDNPDRDLILASSLSDCYPTLPKAVWLLSRIYRLVHSSVFDDLAHQIVHQTTLSLHHASTLISKQASPTDAQLFLIKHLLTLKQQIVAFDIEFVSPDVQFDFSSVTNTFWELRSRGGLFNPLNLVRLVGGSLIPKVVTNMLDAKAELDGRLRTVINDFVDSFAERMTKPLQSRVKDARAATLEVRKSLEKDVPFLRKKLEEYITDRRTKETLVAAVMDKVVEIYEDWYDEWNKGSVGAGNAGRKGKGREDEVWGPGAFGEWATGVFDVGRLSFLDDEDADGESRRNSDVSSL
ncbi:uncharacterized protein PV09_05878 [Verruconis gallopava]|uniref:Conserved oligomeric Golgi complex subunit 3 n=1 Tax=Verruconis gallopava TaxID=253628 RepID=A0A0D2A897_9PEZI|nr:uncharacterized protein PV09_05878 [Verruconis gallopava]KIW02820.1 hypothetical protein PV09_05878 [Verruconis gallopava]